MVNVLVQQYVVQAPTVEWVMLWIFNNVPLKITDRNLVASMRYTVSVFPMVIVLRMVSVVIQVSSIDYRLSIESEIRWFFFSFCRSMSNRWKLFIDVRSKCRQFTWRSSHSSKSFAFLKASSSSVHYRSWWSFMASIQIKIYSRKKKKRKAKRNKAEWVNDICIFLFFLSTNEDLRECQRLARCCEQEKDEHTSFLRQE